MQHNATSRGMRVFSIIWYGQLVSIAGSGLTSFALGLWVYQRTGSVTRYAFIALFAMLPRIALSPLAGAIVDRWERRRVMILSDTGAGLTTLAVALLLSAGRLQIWHIYLAAGASAALGTFQWTAYAAVVPMLVSKKNLGRANGMVQLGQAISEVLSPTLAGVLILKIQVQGVLLIDFATFLCAVFTLAIVRIPMLEPAAVGKAGKESLLRGATHGWTYIAARRGLLGLVIFFAIVNFLWGMVGALITPMILGFTSAGVLGVIISIAGGGMLAGSLVMSLWGGPKRRINGVLRFELLSGLCFLLIGLRPSVWSIAVGAFGAHLTIAIVQGSNQAIWQSKVPSQIQGRVFATQQMITRSVAPLAYLAAGPLADKLFEPLLASGGPLAGSIGRIVGVGSGRGIGLIFVLMGILKVMATLGGYLYPRIRRIEDEVPDAGVDELVTVSR
jgi:DHA3 family macrolide efflux protein-like MFS transporter